jgi:chorismate mutase
MPLNNNNLTSALSRKMQQLRRRVDRIDLKMLQLLQQRTKLSGRIGRMKRRHGAVIYVPERERQLVARLIRLSKGLPPPEAVAALYREVLSSSRAAQGQTPIGLLRASAARVLPASRACFGACDRFSQKRTWTELAKGLETDVLSLALATAKDLAEALRKRGARAEFAGRLAVAGDFSEAAGAGNPPAQRIFIVTRHESGAAREGNRILILIECKSTINAIKSLLHSMSDFPTLETHLIHRTAPARNGTRVTLARVTLAGSVDGVQAARCLRAAGQAAGMSLSILGVYPGSEDYGG